MNILTQYIPGPGHIVSHSCEQLLLLAEKSQHNCLTII